jgi:vanillate O-demethylase ferredoxin subunit
VAVSGAWLELVITAKEREAQDIVRLELVDPAGHELPQFTAGAHLDLEVSTGLIRQYSLCNNPRERHRYVIGILREPQSRGGSQAVHDTLQVGHTVRVQAPRNHFVLDAGAAHHILFAGGIGVTPMLAMAEHLFDSATPFDLHYCIRSRERAAFASRIAAAGFAAHTQFHVDDGPPEQRLEIDRALGPTNAGKHIYVCGPPAFIAFVLDSARTRGWPESALHREFFTSAAPAPAIANRAFEIQLRSTGLVLQIPTGRTIVEVLHDAGINVEVSCEQGVCGTCLTRVLQGEPDHRDVFLTDAEHLRNDQMTLCCSRSNSPRLLLDL